MQVSNIVRAHVIITGDVQGVGYRFYTRQEAKALGLSGWVRNVTESIGHRAEGKEPGRVEAVFEGPEKQVREMIAWCWEGSPTAQVREVRVVWEKPGNLQSFQIIK